MKPLLFSRWRVMACHSDWNCFLGAHELDLDHCALNTREIHIRSGLRSKIKTLMLLGDSTQTPSIRLRVVFLNQLASPALVFHSNLSSNEMATPANRQPSRATIRLRPTLRFLGWGTSKLPSRLKINKAPQVGLEPTTLRLTAGCSAIELL